MARKRASARPAKHANGAAHPFYDAWRTAYHDALYAEMLQAIEEELRDPRRREIVRRFACELAATFMPAEPKK